MKTRVGEGIKRISSLLVVGFLLLFVGCATAPKPVPPPAPAKPETPEAGPAVPKEAREKAPAPPPAAPAPPPPAAPSPAEAPQDPIATGAVLLNPSVPDEAKTIQSRLAQLGFYKMAIDGAWGPGSRAALRVYKTMNRLPKDDRWDKETQVALFGKGAAAAPPVDTSDPIASGAVFLNPADSQDAQTIQGRLAELGFYNGGIDGVWGSESRAALQAFKEKNSLPHPQKWDKPTQMLLFRQVQK